MDSLPSNSHTAKQKAAQEKVVKKVVIGEVIEKKPPFWSRIKDVFGGDFRSVGSYILAEVLLPAARNMVVETTSKGIERMVYGDRAPSRVDPGRPRVQYNNPSVRYSPVQYGTVSGPHNSIRVASNNVNSIVLQTRAEAQAIVEQLGDIMQQYEVASVADFRTMIGEPSEITDNAWGWYNVMEFEIHQERNGGWLLVLPRPVQI